MQRLIYLACLALSLTACSNEPDFVSAFSGLEDNVMEIRMGQMPDLDAKQCNRNMYAGFRSDSDESITLTLDLFMNPNPGNIQKFKREWTLEETSRQGLVAGQTSLFPETVNVPCKQVHVTMLTLACAYGENQEEKPCPLKVRWNWLQGFEMIEIPKVSR